MMERPRQWHRRPLELQSIDGSSFVVNGWTSDEPRQVYGALLLSQITEPVLGVGESSTAAPQHSDEGPTADSSQQQTNAQTTATGTTTSESMSHGVQEAQGVRCTFESCDKVFADEPSFKKHFAHAHTKRMWSCRINQCNQTFPDRLQLTRHQTAQHESELKVRGRAPQQKPQPVPSSSSTS